MLLASGGGPIRSAEAGAGREQARRQEDGRLVEGDYTGKGVIRMFYPANITDDNRTPYDRHEKRGC